MSYETRPNSGSLFRNENKKTDQHPDYSGSANIDGTDYFMDAWLKVADSGRKWMSFSFKAKEKQNKPASRPAVKAPKHHASDDDIPF